MATGWYFKDRNQKEVGPISFAGLRQRASGGGILPETLLRNGTEGNWVPAKVIPGIFDSVEPASTPPRSAPTPSAQPLSTPAPSAPGDETAFDPYYTWLGIPAEEQPPNHYRLLGVRVFEENPDVIDNAADRQMSHLRSRQAGKYVRWSQKLLNEVATAKVCLLNPDRKALYDRQLQTELRSPAANRLAALIAVLSRRDTLASIAVALGVVVMAGVVLMAQYGGKSSVAPLAGRHLVPAVRSPQSDASQKDASTDGPADAGRPPRPSAPPADASADVIAPKDGQANTGAGATSQAPDSSGVQPPAAGMPAVQPPDSADRTPPPRSEGVSDRTAEVSPEAGPAAEPIEKMPGQVGVGPAKEPSAAGGRQAPPSAPEQTTPAAQSPPVPSARPARSVAPAPSESLCPIEIQRLAELHRILERQVPLARQWKDKQAEGQSLETQVQALQGQMAVLQAQAATVIANTRDIQMVLQAQGQNPAASPQIAANNRQLLQLDSAVKGLNQQCNAKLVELTRVRSFMTTLRQRSDEALEPWITLCDPFGRWGADVHRRAIKVFDQWTANEEQKQLPLPYLARAIALIHTGEYDLASTDLDAVQRLDPRTEPLVLTLRGCAFDAEGNPLEAQKSFDAAAQWIADKKQEVAINADTTGQAKNKTAEEIRFLDKALGLIYVFRGYGAMRRGEYPEARKWLTQAVQPALAGPEGYETIAWFYATCPRDSIRNKALAVNNALKAYRLVKKPGWHCLDTLAAAYAESSDFEQALKWASEAMPLVPRDRKADVQARIELYRDNKAYRMPSGSASP